MNAGRQRLELTFHRLRVGLLPSRHPPLPPPRFPLRSDRSHTHSPSLGSARCVRPPAGQPANCMSSSPSSSSDYSSSSSSSSSPSSSSSSNGQQPRRCHYKPPARTDTSLPKRKTRNKCTTFFELKNNNGSLLKKCRQFPVALLKYL